jgi:hypothetical protein
MQSGLNSFREDFQDYDLAPIGIASFQKQAQKLADMGRHGDTYIVHAAEGETVLPMEVLDSNPKLKEMLFTQMRDMGIEPERYVVGSEFNSLNPITGQPEFFLKKIFKGLKNVGKALKKNAATVLPIALNYLAPGMGSTLAGALGAGVGTLIQGDRENALRNALLGGASGAALARLTGGPGGFNRDIQKSLNFGKDLVGGSGFAPGTFRDPFANIEFPSFGSAGEQVVSGSAGEQVVSGPVGEQVANFPGKINTSLPKGGANLAQVASGPVGDSLENISYSTIPGVGTRELTDEVIRASPEYKALLADMGENVNPIEAVNYLRKQHGPSFLQKYGVPLAGVTALAATQGFFDTPEEEEQEDALTGQDLIDADPDKYYIDVARLPFEDQSRVATDYPLGGIPSLRDLSPYPMPVFRANQGGPAFPRRVGAIGPGIGSGRKDDVPAMLTDGEFVMTRNAVRNAGNGNLNQGMKNMYSLMRNLETRRA